MPVIRSAKEMPVCLTESNRLIFVSNCLLQAAINTCGWSGSTLLWWDCRQGDSWDGTSIPRWAWWLIGHPLDANLRWPSFWHYRLCEAARTHGERMVADAVFFMLLEQENIARWRVIALWAAVRFYALFIWKPKQ